LFSRLVYNFITIIITTIIKKIKKTKKKSKTKIYIKIIIIIIIEQTKTIKDKIKSHTNFNKKTNDKN